MPAKDVSRELLHAQVVASASFSIWAYLRSLSHIECEAYATGFHWPSLYCSSTAPIPYDDASADTLVGASRLQSVNIVGLDNSDFTSEKADC